MPASSVIVEACNQIIASIGGANRKSPMALFDDIVCRKMRARGYVPKGGSQHRGGGYRRRYQDIDLLSDDVVIEFKSGDFVEYCLNGRKDMEASLLDLADSRMPFFKSSSYVGRKHRENRCGHCGLHRIELHPNDRFAIGQSDGCKHPFGAPAQNVKDWRTHDMSGRERSDAEKAEIADKYQPELKE